MTEQELAKTLYHWLQQQLDIDNVASVARRFNYATRNPEYLNKIYKELLHLNMWLILFSCERNSSASSSLNQCLDNFFHIVYENSAESAKNDYCSWLLSMGQRYIKNVDITKTGPQLGLASALARTLGLRTRAQIPGRRSTRICRRERIVIPSRSLIRCHHCTQRAGSAR